MFNSNRPSNYGNRDSEDSLSPSSNLWVGNLPADVTEKDLIDLFADYRALDSLIAYSSRTFAFLLFKRVDDAIAAKESLQGAKLRGHSIKIMFAKPAKPCNQLWVGGINSSVTKEKLEEEFLKFGKIVELKFLRERNAAYIEYTKLEDASQALKGMNGRRVGSDQIRVDFLRPVPSRREQFATAQGPNSMGRKGDGQPSNVLWIGYPPSLQVDEQMLHNALILFGEIEKITSFPQRHYSFVEFRSVDEARRAKDGLQGRLFNDPRITIMFSSSSLAPAKDYPGNKGPTPPRPNLPYDEHPFGHNLPGVSDNFPGPGILGPMRPFGQNDRKRTRMDDSDEDRRVRMNRLYGVDMDNDEGMHTRGPSMYGNFHGNKNGSPVPLGTRPINRGPNSSRSENDFIWRGTIAKGGTLVCHARCIPVGKGIDFELPIVVNCSARTGLDMLTKHYTEAIGFEIVYFLPDSELDFASYTEFLHYLGSKDRAGVAKLDDGTTLFLVPPSDFLRNVLKIAGPERLYGVVLKLPQQSPDHGLVHSKEERISQPYYNRVNDEYDLPQKLDLPNTREFSMPHSANSNAVASQSGVSLTPELIATLASFLPPKSSGLESSAYGGVSDARYLSNQSLAQADPVQVDPRAPQHNNQFGSSQFQDSNVFSRPQTNSLLSPPPGSQRMNQQQYGSSQYQDSSVFSRPQTNLLPSPPPGSQNVNTQQYDVGFSNNAQQYYGYMDSQQNKIEPVNVPHHHENHIANFSQPMVGVEKNNHLLHNQVQGSTEGDVDKNLRYQSTLQFAASLLQQIQQKQSNNQAGQGSKNQ